MADIYHQTVKGIYSYPQMNDFISVRNYMYIWQNGKKCLIFRFFNGFSEEINEIEYTVTQIDVNGSIIKQTDLVKKGISVKPGELYSPNSGLLVDEACVDFKLSFKSVRSGKYTYRVFDDMVEAFYPLPEKKFMEDAKLSDKTEPVEEFSEVSRVIGKPKKAGRIAATALVLILLLNVFQIALPYIDFSFVEDFKDYIVEWFEDLKEENKNEQTSGETNSDKVYIDYTYPGN